MRIDERILLPGDEDSVLDLRLDGGIPSSLIATRRGVIAYRAAGDLAAPPVMLTPSVPLSSLSWVTILPLLAGRGFRAIAIDVPGSGDTPPSPEPLDIDGFADAILALIEALGHERVDLVGHATHAASSLRLAVRHPERIRRLVLSKLPWVSDERREEFKTAGPTWYRPDGAPTRLPLFGQQSNLPEAKRDLMWLRQRFEMYKAGPRSAEGHHALGHYDFLEDLPKLRVPLRFVWASEDKFAAGRNILMDAAKQVNPDVRIVEGGTAFSTYERPNGWTEAVASFLVADR